MDTWVFNMQGNFQVRLGRALRNRLVREMEVKIGEEAEFLHGQMHLEDASEADLRHQ
jgi:hypothetical protein